MAKIDRTEIVSESSQYNNGAVSGNARALKVGTILNDQYYIQKVIGEGGFGITYIAVDKYLKINVAIKEYFPAQFATRNTLAGSDFISIIDGERKKYFMDGLKAYEYEANRLTRFNSLEGIVSVMNFFFANNTAYMVMEYIDGISLKEYLKQCNGIIPWTDVMKMMRPVINSLQIIHNAGIIHRDISPDNIMVDGEGKVTIIDFGSARYYEEDKSKTIMLKRGYAPPEQYLRNGKQGPWTDIYSLSATIYTMITGVRLPESLSLVEGSAKVVPIAKVVPDIPYQVEAAIYKGLAVQTENRIQSAAEFEKYLYDGVVIPEDNNKKKRIFIFVTFAIVLAIAIATIVAVAVNRSKLSRELEAETEVVNEEGTADSGNSRSGKTDAAKEDSGDIVAGDGLATTDNGSEDVEENSATNSSSYIPQRFKGVAQTQTSLIKSSDYSDGVAVKDVDSSVTDCKLPEEINGKKVVAIEGVGSNITSIYIPENVQTIMDGAFRNCVYLEYIYIPSSVTFISESAFANCLSLSEIEVSADNEQYYVEDKCLKDRDGSVVVELH